MLVEWMSAEDINSNKTSYGASQACYTFCYTTIAVYLDSSLHPAQVLSNILQCLKDAFTAFLHHDLILH